METNHPKHFVLQLGAMASLYLSVIFLLTLIFNLINLTIPDPSESYWQIESASQNVRLGIAMLVVFFPTYLILTRLLNQSRRTNPTTRSNVARWLLYISLLVGAGAILIDLVVVILAFLNGELTMRFILKALALLVVVGTAVVYYYQDTKDYWQTHERISIIFGGIMSTVVVASLITGLINIETPASVRELKLDEKQMMDLQIIQSGVEEYLRLNTTLPNSLEDLPQTNRLPQAPDGREAYGYEVTESGFKLCATFYRASVLEDSAYTRPVYAPTDDMPIKNPYAWDYEAGRYCFERLTK
jgi:hypothetical protein